MPQRQCPNCGDPIPNRKLIACPRCGEFIKKQRLWETGNGWIIIGLGVLAAIGVLNMIVRLLSS